MQDLRLPDWLTPAQRTTIVDLAARNSFARVRAACAAYDEKRGHARTTDMIEAWGGELAVFA